MTIEKPTLMNMFKLIPSGVGLDIAKNHSGICIWNGESVERYGFSLSEYDKSDYFAEYKMRREFKNKLIEVLRGRSFKYCIIEDVYGGENFDTVRKLLALNTVIDELIFEQICFVDEFFRWSEPVWAKAVRSIYKQRGRLKSKIEIQGILEFLEDEFVLTNKDLSEKQKKEIFYEDICDATAMLLGVVAHKTMELNVVKSSAIKLSDIKVYYLEDLTDMPFHRNKRLHESFIRVDINTRNIEASIIENVKCHPDDLLVAECPVEKLGQFGMKNGFVFYESGQGYLVFFKR